MKKFVMFLMLFSFVSVCLFASTEIVQTAGVNVDWLRDHWAVICLMISEILALTGSKWGGIVKIVLNLIGALLDKLRKT